MLRKEVHLEYYYAEERGWHKPSDATADHKIHISHCIYALLQSLMCSANTDPFIRKLSIHVLHREASFGPGLGLGLRFGLSCWMQVSTLTSELDYWVDIGDEPYPDFSINRQCRDFESVLAWQEERSIPMSQYRNVIRKPQGVTPRIMSLEYKYMVGLIEEDPAKIKEALEEADQLNDAERAGRV